MSLTEYVSGMTAAKTLGLVSIIVPLIFWSIIWKGIALWKSARRSQKWWFIVLLVVNTLGILEIIYIFLVAKKKPEAVQGQA